MNNDYPILLALHPLFHLSGMIPEEKREGLLKEMRMALASGGMEARDSSPLLLLFNYDRPLTAIALLHEQLAQLRKKIELESPATKLPLQFVLHLESKNENPPNFRNPDSSVWEDLEPETLYLSLPLKNQWERLSVGNKEDGLPDHLLEDGPAGFTRLRFTKPTLLRRKRIFPYRSVLAEVGGGGACYYCGLRTHAPGFCPSKQLSMANLSLHDVGYQPIAALIRNFQTAFANRKQMESLLGPGVELAAIRKNPPLQAFVSFFDLLAVYQPRYLLQVAFSIHSVWSGMNNNVRIKQDSRNLQMGLDCLRVGKYDEAKNLLLSENHAPGGRQYAATVGLAFVSLERGRFEEMGHHLQIAASLASAEKEKIHIALLLARYYDLAGNLWKAEQALQGMANLYVDCHEIVYRRLQTAVRRGQGSQMLKTMNGLAEANRLYFMCMLMDPALLPVEGLLEDVLANHLRMIEERTEEALAAAVKEYDRLAKWVDGEDSDFSTNLESLTKLKQQAQRRSYYDMVDVAVKARGLRQAGPRLQDSKLDQLNERIDQSVLEWEKLNSYWQRYPYKSFWRGSEDKLGRLRRRLVDARGVAGESLRRGTAQLEEAQREIEALTPVIKRMENVRMLLNVMRLFLGRLLVVEVACSVLLVLLYLVVSLFFARHTGDGLLDLVRDPVAQRRIIFVVNLLLAPFISLVLTMRRM